jgi:multicomponent Na+:H+ antiporter subunit G
MTVLDVVIVALLAVGALFSALGAIGILRLPDVYTRLSATSKTATLGVACLLLACGLYFRELGVFNRTLAMIVFIFLTAPVAAHIIGRAAFLTGVPFWEGTRANELADSRRGGPASPDTPDGPTDQ